MPDLNALTIALVGPLPPPAGGMANQAQLLSDNLSCSGLSVFFIQTNAAYQPEWIGKIRFFRSFFRLCAYIFKVWTITKKVDVIHLLSNSGWAWFLFSTPVLFIAKLKKVPVIVNYRGGGADVFFNKSWFWIKPSMKMATLVTVPTGYLQQVFRQWDIETTIVPNIINLELFSPAKEKKSKQALHVIVTRNLEKIYGNDRAILAFERILTQCPKAKLTIAGSGPERETLEALVKDKDLQAKVCFVGRLSREAIAKLYQSADIMINASLVDNTPNSIVEALACGVNVVSSSVGGIPYLVEHNTQALLVDNTPEALANAVLRIVNDKSLSENMKAEGFMLVQQFTWTEVYQKLLQAYHAVLENKR